TGCRPYSAGPAFDSPHAGPTGFAGARRRGTHVLRFDAVSACPPPRHLRVVHKMKLLVIGRPGAGKGTQARRVARVLGVPHISTGDLLRDAISEGTPLGLRTNDCVSAGRLVPDSLVGEMLETRLGRADARLRGWLLDGFPRTADQLEGLVRWL